MDLVRNVGKRLQVLVAATKMGATKGHENLGVSAMVMLAETLYKSGDGDAAISILSRAHEQAKGVGFEQARDTALTWVAEGYAKVRDLKSAVSIAALIHEPHQRVMALGQIGIVYAEFDERDAAVRVLHEAESICLGKTGPAHFQVMELSKIAVGFATLGDVGKAAALLQKSSQLTVTIGQSYFRVLSLVGMSEVYLAAGNSDGATNVLREARLCADQLPNPSSRSVAQSVVVDGYAKAGLLEQAMELARGIDDERARETALSRVARGYAHAGDLDTALSIGRNIADDALQFYAVASAAQAALGDDFEKKVSGVITSFDTFADHATAQYPEVGRLVQAMADTKRVVAKRQTQTFLSAIENAITIYVECVQKYEAAKKAEAGGQFEVALDLFKEVRAEADWVRLSDTYALELDKSGSFAQEAVILKALGRTADADRALQKEPRPQVVVDFPKRIKAGGEWDKIQLVIQNTATVDAASVSVKISGSVMSSGNPILPTLKGGERKEIPIRLKTNESGFVPCTLEVSYNRASDGKNYTETFEPEVYAGANEADGGRGPAGPLSVEDASDATVTASRQRRPVSRQPYGGYRRLEPIKATMNASVYRARKDGGPLVALKLPRMQEEEGTMQAGIESAFEKEARNWEKLTKAKIKGVVELIEYGSNPVPWIAMELMDGGDLKDRAPKLKFEDTLALWVEVVDILARVHQKGMIHEDIKPANILFSNKGEVKICDWGLSKAVLDEDAAEDNDQFEGSFHYAAPEQFDTSIGRPDARTDIYQAGAVLYELLTSRHPFEGDFEFTKEGVLNLEPTPPSQVNKNLPQKLRSRIDEVVLKALKRDPQGRYESAFHFRDELQKLVPK